MLISSLLLSLSVSIDSLGIGITYGLRNVKITKIAKIILFMISIIITSLSILIGNVLSNILPEFYTKLIGVILLVCMGFWILYEAFQKEEPKKYIKQENKEKIYYFFLKPFGITIQIIRNPISSDLDDSKIIDAKEALYLGTALSIDSICVGIGSSIIGIRSYFFPLFVAIFQLVFLSIGSMIGKKLSSNYKLNENICNIISGILLIIIGISRFFL